MSKTKTNPNRRIHSKHKCFSNNITYKRTNQNTTQCDNRTTFYCMLIRTWTPLGQYHTHQRYSSHLKQNLPSASILHYSCYWNLRVLRMRIRRLYPFPFHFASYLLLVFVCVCCKMFYCANCSNLACSYEGGVAKCRRWWRHTEYNNNNNNNNNWLKIH